MDGWSRLPVSSALSSTQSVAQVHEHIRWTLQETAAMLEHVMTDMPRSPPQTQPAVSMDKDHIAASLIIQATTAGETLQVRNPDLSGLLQQSIGKHDLQS